MIRLSILLAAALHGLLRTYAPSNILLDFLRTRRGLKLAIPVAVVLVPIYLYAASFTTTLIERGAPGWLNLLVLLLIWNAIKFTVMVPISLLLLVRAKITELRVDRAQAKEGYQPGRELGPMTRWS